MYVLETLMIQAIKVWNDIFERNQLILGLIYFVFDIW